jgi:hypothetical protein
MGKEVRKNRAIVTSCDEYAREAERVLASNRRELKFAQGVRLATSMMRPRRSRDGMP